jgi:hypothetical protein
VVPILEGQDTADPLSRGPAAFSQGLIVTMKPPAAIAQKQSARGRRDQFAERIDAILQRHYFFAGGW